MGQPLVRNHQLDLLRGLAIAGVIAVHVSQTFPTGIGKLDAVLGFGRFGVQLFFLVSAITMSQLWDARASEEHRVAKFYVRRAMRIVPLFYLAVVLYALAGAASFGQVVAHLTFALAVDPGHYLVPGAWSIAIEMLFYAIFPLAIPLMRRPIDALLVAAALNLSWLLLVRQALISIMGGEASIVRPELWYLNFLAQAHVFFVGIFLYRAARDGLSARQAVLAGALVSAWVLAAAIAPSPFEGPSFGAGFVLVVLGLAAFVAVVLRSGVRSHFVERLGQLSYSAYFTHFALITLLWHTFGGMDFVAAFALTTGCAYALGLLSERWIEKPIALVASRVVRSFDRHPIPPGTLTSGEAR